MKSIKPKKKLNVNPITGQIDFTSDNNFSYESVPLNKKLVIHENNQMAIYDQFELEGDLDLHGSLMLEE